MNRPGKRYALLACCLALASPAAFATGLTVAIEQAWRLHPQAAALDAQAAAAQASRQLSDGLTPEPPAVSLGSLNDRQGRNRGKQEWEVELAVPLWLPGQRDARQAAADSLVSEAATRRAAMRLEVAGAVREAWWALAGARVAGELAQRRLATARALDADVRRRHQAGESSRIDANLAQSEVLAAAAEQVDVEAALLQAEQAFRLLTGQAAPSRLDGEDPASAEVAAHAVEHPRLAAAASAARSAWARVKVADASRRAAPELALRVVRARGDFSEPYGNNIGVKLTIPFSSTAQASRERLAAEAEAAETDAALRRAELQLQLDGERARRELAAAERQFAMAQERRALAADNLRLVEKAFTLGESDLATLLRIRAAAHDAESFHERQRLARASTISRLNQTLGVLP